MMIILAAIPVQLNADLWMSMGWVDIVFLCAFIFGVFLGLRRGLANTFPGFFEIIVAQTIAIEYSRAIAEFLHTGLKAVSVEALHIVVFGVLAVGCIILMRFFFRFLSIVGSIQFNPPFNNIGAALLGGIQFMLLIGLVFYFLVLFPVPFIQETINTHSISGPYLVESNQHIHDFFIKWFPDAWRAIK